MSDVQSSICVFCGSSEGVLPDYGKAACQLGEALAAKSITCVYGGGTSGIMGAVAAATLTAGGRVHGIIPEALTNRERKFTNTTAIEVPESLLSPVPASEATIEDRSIVTVVNTMHERKKLMATLSHAFLVLPGGYGTLEELAEMTTWTQLNIHKKPVVCLNINGFYSPLRDFIDGAIKSGFIKESNRDFLIFVDQPLGPDADWGKAALDAVAAWDVRTTANAFQLDWA